MTKITPEKMSVIVTVQMLLKRLNRNISFDDLAKMSVEGLRMYQDNLIIEYNSLVS
jgi:hypothetical protein